MGFVQAGGSHLGARERRAFRRVLARPSDLTRRAYIRSRGLHSISSQLYLLSTIPAASKIVQYPTILYQTARLKFADALAIARAAAHKSRNHGSESESPEGGLYAAVEAFDGKEAYELQVDVCEALLGVDCIVIAGTGRFAISVVLAHSRHQIQRRQTRCQSRNAAWLSRQGRGLEKTRNICYLRPHATNKTSDGVQWLDVCASPAKRIVSRGRARTRPALSGA